MSTQCAVSEGGPKLTSDQYVALKGNRCPFCESVQFAGHAVEIAAGVACQEVTCTDCERSWLDKYKLVGYEEA